MWLLAALVWLLGPSYWPTSVLAGIITGPVGVMGTGYDAGDGATITYDSLPMQDANYDGAAILAPIKKGMRLEGNCVLLAVI